MEDLTERLRALSRSLERAIHSATREQVPNATLLDAIEDGATALLDHRERAASRGVGGIRGDDDPLLRAIAGVVAAARYAADAEVWRGIEALSRAREAVVRLCEGV